MKNRTFEVQNKENIEQLSEETEDLNTILLDEEQELEDNSHYHQEEECDCSIHKDKNDVIYEAVVSEAINMENSMYSEESCTGENFEKTPDTSKEIDSRESDSIVPFNKAIKYSLLILLVIVFITILIMFFEIGFA